VTTIESRRQACAFALLIVASGLVVAWGALTVAVVAEDLGPPVGAMAPNVGTFLDQTLMGRNGLVPFFFWSADWCSYCQAQLIDVNVDSPEIL
jgi:hypothetical protein